MWLGVLLAERSFGHSLVFILKAGIIIWLLADSSNLTGVASGFITGPLSHNVADPIGPIWEGRWEELGYLLWPLTPAFEYPANEDRIFSKCLFVKLVSEPHYQLGLFGLVVLLWIYDGTPGVAEVRRWI